LASSHGARIQRSRSTSVVRITGLRMDRLDHRIRRCCEETIDLRSPDCARDTNHSESLISLRLVPGSPKAQKTTWIFTPSSSRHWQSLSARACTAHRTVHRERLRNRDPPRRHRSRVRRRDLRRRRCARRAFRWAHRRYSVKGSAVADCTSTNGPRPSL
jgi:hypothetical protein